jgi:hypothetical protein
MIVYTIMIILGVIFTLATFVLLLLGVICDEPMVWLIFLVCFVVTIGLWFGAARIENANSVTTIETVDMEVAHCDISSVDRATIIYYLSVTDGERHFVIEVSEAQYVQTKIGDTVQIEITTKVNTMNGTAKTSTSMKGGK